MLIALLFINIEFIGILIKLIGHYKQDSHVTVNLLKGELKWIILCFVINVNKLLEGRAAQN